MNLTISAYNRVAFKGIYANYNPDNYHQYQSAFRAKPEEHKLEVYATRIFRELNT